MRVAEVEIENHPGLGYLHVDFRGSDGQPSRVVVIAGENGCGKTALLEAIFSALAPLTGPNFVLPAEYTNFANVTVMADEDLPRPLHMRSVQHIEDLRVNNSSREFRIRSSLAQPGREAKTYSRKLLGGGWLAREDQTESGIPPVATVCFYSEANVSFAVPKIDVAHASETIGVNPAMPHSNPMRGGSNLASEIAQMFVNLRAADDEDVSRWVRQNRGQAAPEEMFDQRWRIFSSAFARMFPSKRLIEVDRSGIPSFWWPQI